MFGSEESPNQKMRKNNLQLNTTIPHIANWCNNTYLTSIKFMRHLTFCMIYCTMSLL